MPGERQSSWQCPPAATPPERRLGWLNDISSDGQAWLRAQRGHSDWREALDVISGKMIGPVPPSYRSKLNTNHLKRNIREIVGAMAKLRPLWGYSSDNPDFAPNAQLFNLLTKAWYLESFADRAIKDALQYAAATCTGWIRPVYSRDMAGTGSGSVKLLTYGAPCIIPTQLPSSGDFQQAYAVTILDELPIYMAHGMFPAFQSQLRPTSSMYWYSNEIRRSAAGNLWQRIFNYGVGRSRDATTDVPDLFIPIRYTYVIDLTINTTSAPIPMGEPGTSWAYTVPYLGQTLLDGRRATETDARLYPYRRLLISSEACIMYDGPSFDWHGRLPLIPFCMDKWPWEPIGFSLVRDGYQIQQAINEIERGTMDKERALLDLPLAYDINSVTTREADQFDPMRPRSRVGFDATASAKPFEMPVDPKIYETSGTTLQFLDHLNQSMDTQHAIKDVMALAQARMAGDDAEKLLESQGPIIEDMSRSMEPPMRELADQVKYLLLQYMPPARVMQYVGEDNMTLSTFDFDPSSLVPSHMTGEDVDKPSPTDKIRRARMFASNLRFMISPRSLHEITQMVMKLGLLQLRKAGVAISDYTIAQSWSVPNYGTPHGSTEQEIWEWEQERKLIFAARMKELGMTLTQQGQVSPPAAGAAGKQQEGRPPSGQESPSLKTKPDGRAFVSESSGGGQVV